MIDAVRQHRREGGPVYERFDTVGEPITGVNRCLQCHALVPGYYRNDHDDMHRDEDRWRDAAAEMIDLLFMIALKVFDETTLMERLGPMGRMVINQWATLRNLDHSTNRNADA